MIISKRTADGWKGGIKNTNTEYCDICQAKLWVAPSGKPYCNTDDCGTLKASSSYNIADAVQIRALELGLFRQATGGGCDYIAATGGGKDYVLSTKIDSGFSPDTLDEPSQVTVYKEEEDYWTTHLEDEGKTFDTAEEAMTYMASKQTVKKEDA